MKLFNDANEHEWRQLLPLKTYLYLLLTLCAAVSATEQVSKRNVGDPLIYHRLRHDLNYLQLFRKYQLEQPSREKQIQLRFNQTLDRNQTKEVVYTFYENDQIEATSITQDDLILEALDRTYRSRLFPAYIYNYDNPEDKLRAADPNLVSTVRCDRELDYVMEKVTEYERAQLNGNDLIFDPELAAYFDSFAAEEPGLLFGNYHWTGNWRQCNKRLIFSRSDPENIIGFAGRYCVASIKSRTWAKKIEKKVDELLEDGNYFKFPEQQYDYARFFRIQVGICLPESCGSTVVDRRRDDIRRLAVLRLHEPFKEYKMVDLFCLPDASSEFRRLELSGWLFLLATFGWCSLVLAATATDYLQPTKTSDKNRNGSTTGRRSLDKLVSAMSLIRNYKRITEIEPLESLAPEASKTFLKATRATNKSVEAKSSWQEYTACQQEPDVDDKMQDIEKCDKLSPSDTIFLNAFKVIGMLLLIYSHVGILGEHLNRFPIDYESLNEFLFHSHNSAVYLADWFFVITGFLTTYLVFITGKVERNSILQWAYSIFHRYWRLAPVYLIIFWFSRSVFQHTASGPVWDYGASNMTIRSICHRESWLWPLTLTSNLHPIHEECIMPAWYAASDMQFYLITPFILVLLHKSPRWGWLTSITLIVVSVLARIHRYLTDPRAQPLELMRPRFDATMRNNWDMPPTNLYPHYRISTYLIGILAGHYTYMVLSGQWRSIIYLSRFPGSSKPSENKRIKQIKLALRAILWLIGAQFVISMLNVSWIVFALYPRSMEFCVKYSAAIVYGVGNITIGIGLALIIVTFMFGQFSKLRADLSHPIWTLISRLNFFVFLFQVEIIYWLQQSGERVPDLSSRDMLRTWIETTSLCYLLSAVVTLFVEYPLSNLEREFVGEWAAKQSKY